MPILKSAKKALRQTKRRTAANKAKIKLLKEEIKKFKKRGNLDLLPKIYSMVDKMVKVHIFHKNKGKRLKSQLAIFAKAKAAKEKQKEKKQHS